MKIKVHIEEIIGMHIRKSQINSVRLDDIEFYEDGQKIDIPEKAINSFELTGLNNVDFILTNYYLLGSFQNEDV